MELKIDLTPRLDRVELFSLRSQFSESESPRTILSKRGIEFDHYRDYQPSDDAKMIDWRASKRANKLLVRVVREERSLNVLFVVDVGESMLFGSTKKAKIEYVLELVSSLSYGVLNFGDNVGIAFANDGLIQSIPFGNGLEHYGIITNILDNFDKYGGKKDFADSIMKINVAFRNASLVVFLSDFIGVFNDLVNYGLSINNFSEIIGFMVTDPLDMMIPEDMGEILMSDPVDNVLEIVDTDEFRLLYDEANQERLNKLREFFLLSGNDFSVFDVTKDFIPQFTDFIVKRENKFD